MATLAVKIDPGQAVQGARTIRREIEWVESAAVDMEKAVDKAADAAGKIGSPAALGGARNVKRSVEDIAKASDGAGRNVTRFTGAANDNFAKLNRQVASVTSTFRALVSVLGPLAALFSVRALSQYADAWSDMQSRVGAAVKNMEAAPRLMQRIVDIANASYSPLAQTAEVYARNMATLRDYGRGAMEAADFTEALNHALVITATKGQDADVVINSYSRAISNGKLRTMEFETIMSRSPRLLEAVADHLGVTITELRRLAAEGKVTGEALIAGPINSLNLLREQAAEMPATIGDAFTRIGTNLNALIGQMDKAAGTSEAIAGALISVADGIRGLPGILDAVRDRLDDIAEAAAMVGLAMSLVFGRAALTAMAYTFGWFIGVVLTGLAAVKAAILANPLGALAVGIAAAIVAAYHFRDEIKQAIGIDVVEIARTAANTLIGSFVAAAVDIRFVFDNLGDLISAAIIGSVNVVIKSINHMVATAKVMINDLIDALNNIPGIAIDRLDILNDPIGLLDSPAGDRLAHSLERRAKEIAEALEFDYLGALREVAAGTRTAEDAIADLDKALGGAASALGELGPEYEKLIDSAQRRLDQMQEEIGLVGKAGLEADALRFKYDLLAKAKEQNINLGPDEKAKIDELTESYRRLSTELAALEAMDDIMFERGLIGLSDGDQRILGFLRQIGIEADSAYGQMIAGGLRTNQVMQKTQDELKAMQDVGKDAFMSILDLLYETGDVGEKLIGIFANIGKEFARMGMERLWKSFTGEGGSVFGSGTSGTATGGLTPVQTAQIGREIGYAISPPITDSLNGGLQSYAAAIRKIESGSYQGNYGAVGPMVKSGSYAGDHAYGAYQVMGKNIASWTKEATGTSLSIQQFLSDKGAQDKVFASKFGQSLDKFGNFADATSVWFSGRPMNRAGNASDGYNTVPQYVQKAEGALAGYNPGTLKTGVSAGMVDASRKIAHMPEMAGNGPGGFTPVAGGNMQNMLGVGGAAFGAFAGGMQSGDPLMGGISGAMSGLGAAPMLANLGLGAAAGPVGLIGGAVIGLIGGLIGQAKKKREELAKAREELEGQMGAITKLIATSTGNFMGSIETLMVDRMDEFNKALKLADKAENRDLGRELTDAQTVFINRTIKKWRDTFDGIASSLEDGTGFEGAFVAGVDAIDKMREGLVGFVNDAKLFSKTDEEIHKEFAERRKGFETSSAKMWEYAPTHVDGMNENATTIKNDLVDGYLDLGKQAIEHSVAAFKQSGEQLYETLSELKAAVLDAGLVIDDLGMVTRAAANDNTDYAGAVERAMLAAQQAARAMITGAEEFTAVEQAVQKLMGGASMLPELLQDLGMSAEQAAEAIEKDLIVALDKLRQSVMLDVRRSINELADAGFLNDFADAQESYQARLKDLAAAGISGSHAIEELGLRMRKIAGDAELTDDQLRRLAGVFPEIGGAILSAVGMITDGTGSALSDAKAALDEAKANLRSAYDEEKRAIEQVISRMQSLSKSLRQFLDDLRIDSSLSPLSNFERMEEAQRQFRDIAAKAQGGDEDALAELEGTSRDYLDRAKAYWASSESYFAIFSEVESVLGDALGVADRQLSEAERQLAALDTQIAALIEIDTAVKSVADAIIDLTKAEQAYETAQLANDAYQNSLFEQMLALMAEQRTALGDVAASMAYLNANRDVMDAIGTGQDFGTGSADIGTLAGAHWNQYGQYEQRDTGLGQRSRGAEYLKNNPDVLESIRGGQNFGTGLTDLDALAKVHWEAFGQYENRIKGYANGGDHFGGLRIVGERGPELEATGPSRIWTANQTQSFMRGGNDNREVVAAIGRLEQQNRELQAEVKALRGTVGASGNMTTQLLQQGNAEMAEVATELKKAGAR